MNQFNVAGGALELINPRAIGRVAYLLRHRPYSCQFPIPCLSKPNQLEAVAWVVAVLPRHSVKKEVRIKSA